LRPTMAHSVSSSSSSSPRVGELQERIVELQERIIKVKRQDWAQLQQVLAAALA